MLPHAPVRREAAAVLHPADSGFLEAFEALRLDPGDFRHRDHVRLAWILLRCDPAGARARVAAGIRRFATHHGAAAKYHATITEAWMRMVAAALRISPATPGAPFEAWIETSPALLDPGLLRRHYSEARLMSEDARTGWVTPDLAGGGPLAD